VSGVAFAARDLDRLVRRQREHTRMAIEGTAHLLAGPHLDQHGVHHLFVRVAARFTFLVVLLEAADVRVHPREPQLDDPVGQRGEHDIGLFYVAAGQRGDVRPERHAHSDTYQGSGRRHSRLLIGPDGRRCYFAALRGKSP
jgi:hypothetical protein